jgi:hypothetical protein
LTRSRSSSSSRAGSRSRSTASGSRRGCCRDTALPGWGAGV